MQKYKSTVFAEINAPGAYFLEAMKQISKPHRFCVLPPLKNHPSKAHRFCVLPPLKNHQSKVIGFVYSPLWKIPVFGGRFFWQIRNKAKTSSLRNKSNAFDWLLVEDFQLFGYWIWSSPSFMTLFCWLKKSFTDCKQILVLKIFYYTQTEMFWPSLYVNHIKIFSKIQKKWNKINTKCQTKFEKTSQRSSIKKTLTR